MLPELSHLQYLTLKILLDAGGGYVDRAEIRRQFLAGGAGNRSHAAFYQFMDRLEEGGFVEPNGRRTTVHYRITKKGRAAMVRSQRFYTP